MTWKVSIPDFMGRPVEPVVHAVKKPEVDFVSIPDFMGRPVEPEVFNNEYHQPYVSIPDFMGRPVERVRLQRNGGRRLPVSIPDFMGRPVEQRRPHHGSLQLREFQSPILWGGR